MASSRQLDCGTDGRVLQESLEGKDKVGIIGCSTFRTVFKRVRQPQSLFLGSVYPYRGVRKPVNTISSVLFHFRSAGLPAISKLADHMVGATRDGVQVDSSWTFS